jgi:hypothetical protein
MLKLRNEVIVECMIGCKPIKAWVTSNDSKATFEKKCCEGSLAGFSATSRSNLGSKKQKKQGGKTA